jgi:NH3-dependent NAD+ synthetase
MDLKWRTEYVRALSEEFDEYVRQKNFNLPVLSVSGGRESKAMGVKENRLTIRRWEVENYVVRWGHTTHLI